jgi:hypothetical protein
MRVLKPSTLTTHAGIVFKASKQCPEEFFKALFYGTSLSAAARRMSHPKVAPEGLKPQECERNTGRSKPPISYITKKDVIKEAVDFSANILKLTLPHKVELPVPN